MRCDVGPIIEDCMLVLYRRWEDGLSTEQCQGVGGTIGFVRAFTNDYGECIGSPGPFLPTGATCAYLTPMVGASPFCPYFLA